MTAEQMTLRIKLRDEARFENFYGQRNQSVAQRLQRFVDSEQGALAPVLVICGASDTGKSHLLQSLCHQAETEGGDALYVSLAELKQFGPMSLDGLLCCSLLCLDDLDAVAGEPDWEERLFQLYNQALDDGVRVAVSLADLPGAGHLKLPDLVSRLQHGVIVQLGAYQDDDRIAILTARAERRGLELSEDVARFILRRSHRSLNELLAVLDRLDETSLKAQRRLTIPFVKSVMGW